MRVLLPLSSPPHRRHPPLHSCRSLLLLLLPLPH
eukprot:COSAG05_NODE_31128_length_101_cov_40.000000_1_plen_33_part_11